jgi:hypothetical protein
MDDPELVANGTIKDKKTVINSDIYYIRQRIKFLLLT